MLKSMQRLAPSAPTSHTETNVTLGAAPATRTGTVETTACELRGSWTELAIALQVPSAWGDVVGVRAYALGDTGAQLVASWDGAGIDYSDQDAGVLRARLRASGQMGDGWRVTFVSSAAPPAGAATVNLLAWNGDGQGVAGESARITPAGHTPRAALGYALASDGYWYPVDGGAPSGGKVSPTSQAHEYVWTGSLWVPRLGDSRGNGFTRGGMGDPADAEAAANAPSLYTAFATSGLVHDGPTFLARFDVWFASSLALQLFDKSSPPALGDVAIWQRTSSAGSWPVGIDFREHLYFSNGLAWGFSTTANTFTSGGTASTVSFVYR